MTHFIFDCDDVLLDWKGGFMDYVEEHLGRRPDPAGSQTWDLGEWLGCSSKEAYNLVHKFNASNSFSILKAVVGANELLWNLVDAGHTVAVLTACGDDLATKRARFTNLDWEFSDANTGDNPFKEVHFLPLGASKFDFLYQYTRNRDTSNIVFVEDSFQHALSGVVNGIRSVCLRCSHNRADERDDPDSGVIWLDQLSDIHKLILPLPIVTSPTCPRCGAGLRVETVLVPVTKNEIVDLDTHPNGFMPVTRYEDREEVSECVRCTGAY